MEIDVEATYREHGPQVLRRCRFLLRDEEAAVDAMHDVFVELLRRRGGWDDRATVALLHRMATHHCLNRLARTRRRAEDAADARVLEIAAAGDLEASTAASRLLATLFGEGPASTRTIAVLHLVDGMTLEQTAEVVGMSVSGVRKRLRVLAARLRAVESGEARGTGAGESSGGATSSGKASTGRQGGSIAGAELNHE